jgi:hypothetical protein
MAYFVLALIDGVMRSRAVSGSLRMMGGGQGIWGEEVRVFGGREIGDDGEGGKEEALR